MKAEKDYAALWEEAFAKESLPEPTIEKTFAGIPCVVRRVNASVYYQAGFIPQAYTIQVAEMQAGEREKYEGELTAKENVQLSASIRLMVVESVISPRLVTEPRALQSGEVSYLKLMERKPEFIEEVTRWIFEGCPGIPVALESGEAVEVSDLKKFRAKGKSR